MGRTRRAYIFLAIPGFFLGEFVLGLILKCTCVDCSLGDSLTCAVGGSLASSVMTFIAWAWVAGVLSAIFWVPAGMIISYRDTFSALKEIEAKKQPKKFIFAQLSIYVAVIYTFLLFGLVGALFYAWFG